jgi:hypothetical protein
MKKMSLAFVLGMFVLMTQSELGFAGAAHRERGTVTGEHDCVECQKAANNAAVEKSPNNTGPGPKKEAKKHSNGVSAQGTQ